MDKCREEFEKIEWVKERLRHVWWSQNNEYCDTGKHSRANASFLNGALHLFTQQQPKVDELTKQRDSFIKAYEIEMDESVELKKRLDAVKTLIEEYRDPPTEDKTFQHALSIVADELEQALKGEQP